MPIKATARYVLGHNNGQHVLLEDACVVYSGDTIEYVGHNYTGPVDEELNLGDALLMPGLIDLDALTDIDHLILDSWAGPEQAKGHQWSEDYFRNARADVFTAEERQQIREYALIQLVLHGITTYMPIASEVHSEWAESFEELVGMAESSRRLGLRGYLGPAYRSGVNVVLKNGQRSVMFDVDRGRELDVLVLHPGLDGVVPATPADVRERDDVGQRPAFLALVLPGPRIGAIDRQDARVLRAIDPRVVGTIRARVRDVRHEERVLVRGLHFVDPARATVLPRQLVTLVVLVRVDRRR